MAAYVSILRKENAGPKEFDRLFELLMVDYAENGLTASINREKVAERLKGVLDEGAVVIAMEDDVIVGCLGIEIRSWWYSDDLHFSEFFTFVHPDHRKSSHAKNMLKAANLAAAQWGLPLFLAVVTHARTEGKCRLFRRYFKSVGQLFQGGKLD